MLFRKRRAGSLATTHGKQVSVRSELLSVRVLLVDDQELLRRGVAQVLEGDTEIRVVGEAGAVSAALRRAPAVRPDVAVVGTRLPDRGDARVCEQLRAVVPGLRCLVLGESVTVDGVPAATLAGASGYLGKHVPGPVLLAAVRTVASAEPSSAATGRHCPVAVSTAEVTGWPRSPTRNARCSS